MDLTRHLLLIVVMQTVSTAFARGALGDSADFWTRKQKTDTRAASVLEKGYAAPGISTTKRMTAGADDADLLLGLLAAEVESETAMRTNAVVKAPVAESPVSVERTNIVERVVEVGRPILVENPVTNVIEKIVDRPVVIEKIVERTNVVEKVVEKPVEIEKIVEVEKPVTNTVEVVKIQKVEVEVEKPVTNFVEKIVEKPVDRIVEKVVTVERPVTNIVERVVEVEKKVVVEKPVKVVVERTNVVEKVVYDRSVELRLAQDKTELERRGGMLEARNAGLEKRNDELKRELQQERRRRERLERALPGADKAKAAKTCRPARITSRETYYDRKRGIALFDGNVYVDDENYQMHADKAYVFAAGSNDVRRIVAVGHVALTNEMRRAYGGKVSYYRQNGMVVLYAGDGIAAEVRDESKSEDQAVRGSRIKFWIGNDQVEVLDATITAPIEGAGMGIDALGK